MPRYDLYDRPWNSTVSPGASSVPANKPPSITVFAPAAIALATSPAKRMPPSAISGTPVPSSARATSSIAVICGTPTPATIRVVQIEPGPMPTFTASAPASASALAPAPVATLPPTTSVSGNRFLIHATRSSTPCACPCAVSTTSTSTPAATSASARASVPAPTPTAAPTRRRPWPSFAANGCVVDFSMSVTVIRPFSSSCGPSTTTRLMRWRRISSRATSSPAPSRTVTNRSRGVITAATGCSRSVSKRTSRLVTIPTTRPFSTTGKLENPRCFTSATTSPSGSVGGTLSGSFSTPDSNRFTRPTSAAWRSTLRFLWTIPMPPSCASAIARRASVTVSMADETMGMLRATFRVSRAARFASRGSTLERAGTSNTSSNVSEF